MTRLPPWVEIALRELGQKEVPGAKDNPRILHYANVAGLSDIAKDDETPWCATFANFTLCDSGHRPGTQSAAAISFEKSGKILDNLRAFILGCYVVLKRTDHKGDEDWRRHVAIYLGHSKDNKTVWLLGGNQGNRVSIQSFDVERITALRWPHGAPILTPWVGRLNYDAKAFDPNSKPEANTTDQ